MNVGLKRMPQVRVAAGLMMNVKPGPLKSL